MVIRAAGFVLFHDAGGEGSDRRYLLLRNASHGTWGFPKGHRDGAESDMGTAVRELAEETGIRRFRPLPGFRRVVEYTLPDGNGKTTVYYLARAESRELARSPEHDAAEWVDLAGAEERLQFEELRELIRAADAQLTRPEPAPPLERAPTRCTACGSEEGATWLDLARDHGPLYGLLGCDPCRAPAQTDRYLRCPNDGRIRLEQQLREDLWHAFTFAPLHDGKHAADRPALEAAAAHDVEVMGAANLLRGRRWLEVGSGYGYTLARARAQGYDAEGIDIAPAKLAFAEDRLGVPRDKLHLGDPMGLALPAAAYDIIWSMHVIEHVPDPDAFLERLFDWCKPGGRLLLATPNAASWKARKLGSGWGYATPFGHLWLFEWDTLRAAVEAAGFRVVRRVNRIAVEGPVGRLAKHALAAVFPDALSELCLVAERPA